ncbi:MAG: hypothetical protein JSW11_07810 [Candidatus Heimdallarchaeota archaeon]|nr:MAG: hypothetical protein JSW11_07810 [Candidatus Heimdallarchaeota archaeon]
MRKLVLGTWIIIVIISSGLLISSMIYEMDEYQGIVHFEFYIDEVNILTNDLGEMTKIQILSSLWNPSRISSFELNMIEVMVFLNGEESISIQRKWFYRTINPKVNTSIKWLHDIDNVNPFIDANATGDWNWYFYIQINIESEMVESVRLQLFDRSQPFQGVGFI